jgi:hypothetical protein
MRALGLNNKLSYLKNLKPESLFINTSSKNFGILNEYNERKNKKLVGHALFTDEPKFWVTSSRPPNFGEHLDVRTKLDNWFDENR